MKNTLSIALTEDSAFILEGSVSVAFVTILQTAVLRMIPYAVPALLLILLDLIYGVPAARIRGEKVTTSTAISRTVTKIFKYMCWLVLATTLAIAFGKAFLEWGTLALVYINEAISIIGNYLETKGIQFSFAGLYRWLIKIFAKKVSGEEMTDEEAAEIIKPKQERDPKTGQFIKKTTL